MTKLTREDIIICAGRRFALYGYHGTSMRDLGDDLGILGSSIYAHVGGKHELLVAVVERAGDLFAQAAEAAQRVDRDATETLLFLMRGHLDVLIDHAAEAKTFLNEAAFLETEDRARVTKARDAYEAVYRETIRRGVDDGDFRSDVDPTLTGIYILSILNAVIRWYHPDGPVDRRNLAFDMHAFVLRGLITGVGNQNSKA